MTRVVQMDPGPIPTFTASAPALPFPYSEKKSSEFYKAAKEVYDIGKNLTAGQKAIADWWADSGGSGVGVPAPYHLLWIITEVLESQKANLAKAASTPQVIFRHVRFGHSWHLIKLGRKT